MKGFVVIEKSAIDAVLSSPWTHARDLVRAVRGFFGGSRMIREDLQLSHFVG